MNNLERTLSSNGLRKCRERKGKRKKKHRDDDDDDEDDDDTF